MNTELIPLAVSSTLGFTLVDRFVASTSLVNPFFFKKRQEYSKVEWTYRNTLVSFVHSIISSIWVVYCIFEQPKLLQDYVSITTASVRALYAFSLGYFAYDGLVVFSNGARRHWAVLIHHSIVLLAIGCILTTNIGTGWGVHGFLMEINSIFLHLRRLIKLTNSSPSQVNIIVRVIQMISFIAFRIIVNTSLVLQIVFYGNPGLPSILFAVGIATVFTFWFVNLGLFYRLVESEISNYKTGSKRAS